MEEDSHYFLQHVPQSEYRITKASRSRKPVYIDQELKPLSVSNKEVNHKIRHIIEDKFNMLIGSLIGTEDVDETKKNQTLDTIYDQLGI